MTADERVLETLSGGPKSNREIRDQLGISSPDPILDASLRRLKQQGKIQVVDRRWVLTSARVCPECRGKGWLN